MRRLTRESRLSPQSLILPLFVEDSDVSAVPLTSMPGVSRWNVAAAVEQARQAMRAGISAVALFPKIPESAKDNTGESALKPDGFVPRLLQTIKNAVPDMLVISDVALDPYSDAGHDGIVSQGRIENDTTVEILAAMAVLHAQNGADIVAPSDMMDGRVGAIREALDGSGFSNTAILSYTAKYASAFYGPFREALDSAPKAGDKKTYQMDFCNRREAQRELALDLSEGADIVMVKPAMSYLDIIRDFRENCDVPVFAYQVSGELAMIEAAAERGWGDRRALLHETLSSIHRAGADGIFCYKALEVADILGTLS